MVGLVARGWWLSTAPSFSLASAGYRAREVVFFSEPRAAGSSTSVGGPPRAVCSTRTLLCVGAGGPKEVVPPRGPGGGKKFFPGPPRVLGPAPVVRGDLLFRRPPNVVSALWGAPQVFGTLSALAGGEDSGAHQWFFAGKFSGRCKKKIPPRPQRAPGKKTRGPPVGVFF